MYANRPIIGIAGGIGSGKSTIAGLFGEMGCVVIDSDAQVRAAYERENVKRILRQWWGSDAFTPEGEVNRSWVARRVFSDSAQRSRLEQLLHPLVRQERDRVMSAAARGPHSDAIVAYVWDTPLLVETGLHQECDAVVFVDAPLNLRLGRVRTRGQWSEADLIQRENLQMPLDNKRQISDYVIRNTADAAYARDQVREILSRIAIGLPDRPSRP